MVLESIVMPESAERSPWQIIVLSFVFVSIGVWTVTLLGVGSVGMMLIALVAVASLPLILRLFNYEERELEQARFMGSRTLARHVPVVIVLLAFFLGMVAGFTFWYLYLPSEVSKELFAPQVNELKAINSAFYAYATKASAGENMLIAFETIFLHNLQVLSLIVLFSLIYGAGSVLILAWNASVVGVFIGEVGKKFVLNEVPAFSLVSGVSYGFLGILPHGTFELLSYSVGALAGGILSSAIIRGVHKQPSFALVLHDVAKLSAWAVVLLAVGAVIESAAFA